MPSFSAAPIRLLVLFHVLNGLLATSQDFTLDPTAIGAAVVKASVAKIDDADIFTEDYNFVRYLAKAETDDGSQITEIDTGGIWKVESETFDSISTEVYNVSSFYPAIESAFGISWASVVYDDLKKPLYSALATRLHLAHLQKSFGPSIPRDPAQQGLWWSLSIHPDDTELTSNTYQARIADLLTGCPQPARDVVFMVDSSVASGETNLDLAKLIVENVIKELKIDSNQNVTTVGIAPYSTGIMNEMFLNGSATESDLTDYISAMVPVSGVRFTGAATEIAINSMFQVDNGAKGFGIPQVLIVVTSGESYDSVASVAETASQGGVSVIAVGITDEVSEGELNMTASDPDDEHVFRLNETTFPQSELEYALYEQICDEGLVAPVGAVISGVIQQGQSRFFKVNTTSADIIVQATEGTMNFYYSTTVKEPNSALHDFSLAVEQNNVNYTVDFPTTEGTARSSDGGVFINVYLGLESTSEVDVHFLLVIENNTVIPDVVVNVTLNVTTGNNGTSPGTSDGLSAGEIAGIVFSCLIVFCGALIALVYYRFGKFSDEKKPLMQKDDMNRFNDSSGYSETKLFGEANGKVVVVEAIEDIPKEEPEEQEEEEEEEEEMSQDKRNELGVRERLHSAIRRHDIGELMVAVEDFRSLRLVDTNGDYLKGQRMIAIQQCKEGLTRAINVRNIKILQKAIFQGKKMEYDSELKVELINAEILLQELKKIETLLRRLKHAMDAGDLETVEVTTAELRAMKGCDQATIDRLLLMFRYREDLELAMQCRAIAELRSAMAKIIEEGFQQDLITEMNQAKRILRDLEMMEKARNDVMGLQQSKVSEIRSYGNPPPGVHEVMMSVYLLLNHAPSQLQSWTAIQALMGKTGREGLRRMVSELQISNVDIAHAKMAGSLLSGFDLRSIRDISEGLAVFYLFARTVTGEVEKLLPSSSSTQHSPQIYHGHHQGMTPVIIP